MSQPEPELNREAMRSLARGWGRVADQYVERLFHELDDKPFDRALLERFAGLVAPGALVADVGCGPGHVARHLCGMGLEVCGVDLCDEMVALGRSLVPEATFQVGDMLELEVPTGSWGGCVALYSLINVVREDAPHALAEFARALAPGSPLLVSVHRGAGTFQQDALFDEPVPMAVTLYELDEMRSLVEGAGFDILEATSRPAYETEYPTERVYVLARRGR